MDHRFDCSYLHGRLRLDRLDDVDADTLALLSDDERFAATGLTSAVFLDTETTGLAGGTGTYAFLVGLGFFEQDAFLVRLVFMRDLQEEPACLHVVEEVLASANTIVTFNGKTFDVPLLATRFAMNGRRPDLRTMPHLDLLHPSRRLYRGCFEDCRLGTLEAEVLGLRREGDVASAEVPDLYLEYLRTKDGRTIQGVLSHNLLDILSLVTLTAQLAAGLVGDDEALSNPDVILGSARLLEIRGCLERARNRYELALERSGEDDAPVAAAACWSLAQEAKRNQDFERAAEHLWTAVEREPANPLYYEALAKLHEHQFQDLARAEEIVVEALEYLHTGAWEEKQDRWIEVLKYRLARLRRKQGQGEGRPG